MTARLFFPQDPATKAALVSWGCGLLPVPLRIDPTLSEPIGIMIGTRLLAVAIFTNYVPETGVIELTAAAKAHPVWWGHRDLMADILRYPFVQLGVRKLMVHIPHTNRAANRFAAKAGLTHEAVLRHHYADKIHAEIWSMTAREYRKSRWAVREREAA